MKRKTYTVEEAKAACLEYFGGDSLAADSTVEKYLLRDGEGNLVELTPNDYLCYRIPAEFHRIEMKYPNPLPIDEIRASLGGITKEALEKNPELKKQLGYGKIVTQGGPTFGIGNNFRAVSLGNCYVLGQPTDSYGGILKKDEEIVQVCKRRGGAGVDISSLRPKGSFVNNAAMSSDGVFVFMKRYSNSTKEVAQGGRRGALMISIDCRHPEIMTFINAKRNKKDVTGANISVKWHDDFFEALQKGGKYMLRFPVDVPPEKAKCTREIDAKELWDAFIDSAWTSAEPGCFFWDTVIEQSMSDCYADEGFRTITSNPCGEINMSAYNACLLMLLNLMKFVKNPYMPNAEVDWEEFDKQIAIGVRLMDDLVDLEIEKMDQIIAKIKNDPEPEDVKRTELELWQKVREFYIKGRRTGFGVTGLADMLAELNIKYDSKEALHFCDKLFARFQENVYRTSAILAKERGAFPCWDWEKEKDSYYIKKLPKDVQDLIKKYGRRHIAELTMSPAGTTSLVTLTSSGIEPVYVVMAERKRKMTADEEKRGVKPDEVDFEGHKWIKYQVLHPGFSRFCKTTGKTKVEESPYYKCDAMSIDPMFRVKMQGIIQSHIDHSISSTINLPESTTRETISHLYLEGWKRKCKGLTIYRAGSLDGVIKTAVESNDKKSGRPDKIVKSSAPKRPVDLPCHLHLSLIKGTKWVFIVGMHGNDPYEVFGGKMTEVDVPRKFIKGKEATDALVRKNPKDEHGISSYDLVLGSNSGEPVVIKDIANKFSPDNGSPTRLISMTLRHGIEIKDICEQIRKVPQEDSMLTFERGISRVLRKYVADKTEVGGSCPECKSKLIYEGGCVKCSQCPWSRCD